MALNIGNRIFTKIDRADREIVNQFEGIPSSNIGDMMNRLYCMREGINRIGQHKKSMVGTAFTVKVPDGDNVFIHKALDLIEEGDILVIDGNGCTSRSLMGEVMFTYAMNRGVAGIVVDGAIRDSDSLDTLDIPVYAVAVTPQGPYKNGPGEINVPVACGGQVVNPGDILVGDADGVCVIHKEDAEAVLEAVKVKFSGEQKLLERYHTVGNDTEKHIATYKEITDRLGTEII
ncbi:MAG: RraA family protein [Eubacteriales bacterium]|nr:RraA family protein [Eubacteriales bacterium]